MLHIFHRWTFVKVLFLFTSSVFAQDQVTSNFEVVQPVAMGISQPMRDLPISTGTEKSF